MWRDKRAAAVTYLSTVLFAALLGTANCQTFTLHPRNVTTLYDRTVVFTCGYTTTNSQPQWLIAAGGGAFGLTQTLTFPTSQGLYSYLTATPLQAQVSVRALTNTPGLNNTCLSCRFITTGLVESGRGCLIIASPPLKPIVSVLDIQFNSITLKWDMPWSHYPIQNYTVELQNFAGVQISTKLVPKESLTYTVAGLVGETRYRFRVRANSDAGHGEWSDAISEDTALSSTTSGQGLSVEVIGIIVGCILAVVVIIIAIIAVIACVYCW